MGQVHVINKQHAKGKARIKTSKPDQYLKPGIQIGDQKQNATEAIYKWIRRLSI